VEIIDRVVGAAQAGDDANVAVNVLVELHQESVTGGVLRLQVNVRQSHAVHNRSCPRLQTVGAIVSTLISVAHIEFVERVIAALRKTSWRTNQRDYKQQQGFPHNGSTLPIEMS